MVLMGTREGKAVLTLHFSQLQPSPVTFHQPPPARCINQTSPWVWQHFIADGGNSTSAVCQLWRCTVTLGHDPKRLGCQECWTTQNIITEHMQQWISSGEKLTRTGSTTEQRLTPAPFSMISSAESLSNIQQTTAACFQRRQKYYHKYPRVCHWP